MISPLPKDSSGFTSALQHQQKTEEIIGRLNWLVSVTPCNFVDGRCIVHGSPQVYTYNTFNDKIATFYCGVAEAKMRERVANQKTKGEEND